MIRFSERDTTEVKDKRKEGKGRLEIFIGKYPLC